MAAEKWNVMMADLIVMVTQLTVVRQPNVPLCRTALAHHAPAFNPVDVPLSDASQTNLTPIRTPLMAVKGDVRLLPTELVLFV